MTYTKGKRFDVLRPVGSVADCKKLARQYNCIAYVEQHLNATSGVDTNYSLAIVGPDCPRSVAMAKQYTELCAKEFNIKNGGVLVGARGHGNVYGAGCPHFLAEPGFISNPRFAGIARTGGGIDAMARCLTDVLVTHFPNGGRVALVAGHRDRGTGDPGAPVYMRPDETRDGYLWEADIADAIVVAATKMLTQMDP